MGSYSAFARRRPDSITEELVTEFLKARPYEFKALFTVIRSALLERKVSGGEEMMRLRTYEKLQNLVLYGQVKKTGKIYKGVRKPLLVLAESLKELRLNCHKPHDAQADAEKADAPVTAKS